MRLVAGVLALTLFAPFVRADETAAPAPASPPAEVARNRVPLRVVRVMPESRQALLFDRGRATHVLAEVGTQIDGYSVDDIDDDEVTLSRDGKQYVLAAPAHRRERDRDAGRPRSASAARRTDTAAGEPTPVDPYGDGAAAPQSAIEAGDGGVRVARAPAASGASPARPVEAGADGVRVAQAPSIPGEPPSFVAGEEVRVVRAPSIPGEPAPSAASDDVRTTAAPSVAVGPASSADRTAPAASPAPTAPSGIAPSATAPSAIAPSTNVPSAGAPSATAPSTNVPAPAASGVAAPSTPIVTAEAPPPGARAIDPRSIVPAVAAPDQPVAARPARAKPASRRVAAAKAPASSAASKQTREALALANMLSAGGEARSPRGPAPDAMPAMTEADEAPPAARAAATSEARTAAAGAIVVSRGEVDGALSDFSRLTAAIDASFSDAGVVVARVAPGTIFARAGIEAGDTITAIDGARLRSLDDAANLYARASTASALTVQLVRASKPVTLHVAIQ